MFDPHDGPRRREIPAFSLDRKDQMLARQRGKFSRMEWRIVVFLPILLVVLAWFAWDLRNNIADVNTASLRPFAEDLELPQMPRPDFDSLPPLPSDAEVETQRETARELVAADKHVPLTANDLDATTIAWAEARLDADRASLPLPQRLSARDLLLTDHVRLGTPLILEGLLDDRLPAPVEGSSRPWQRLLLAIDEGQYVEVLSDARSAAETPLGLNVRVTGRLLNYGELKAGTTPVPLPIIMGRVIAEASAPRDEKDAMAEFHRPWSMPDGVYDEIDDFRLWTETKPYYYTLGQVLRDQTTAGVYDDVPDGNQAADDVHLRPSEFRGKIFRISGRVYQAWEDKDIPRDQPFGVGRVVRVLMWNKDFAPLTETKDGVTTRTTKVVLRLYEFAAITNQPLPEVGAKISAVGRFLKKRAIAVKSDPQRDRANNVQRQSDRVYTWMYVTGPWTATVEPPPDHQGPFAWLLVALSLAGLVIGVIWWRKEVGAGSQRAKAKVEELRAKRSRGVNPVEPPASPPQDGGQAPPSA